MEFQGKKLENLVVTLPLADGSELDCGVYTSFEVGGKTYFALQPLGADKKPDPSQGLMLYRVDQDAAGEPIIAYIESDFEYDIAARKLQQILVSTLS